jgi:8-oxo-dGTP pyrophosphatase MutT (NUDIX family)
MPEEDAAPEETPDAAEEHVYEVDDDDNVLRVLPRSVVHDRRLRHRSVAVLCRDPDGRILVHRRTATKRVAPSCYDMFVAGAVSAGESYAESAVREVSEEIGVPHARLEALVHFRYDGAECPQWTHCFGLRVDGPIVAQESEIAWWTWLTEDELAARLRDTGPAAWPFTPDSRIAYEHCLAARDRS